MSTHAIETILAKQLASYLAMPVFLIDPAGKLLFYNEPAEELLGYRFEETGEMPLDTWLSTFEAVDDSGQPLPLSERPLVVALQKQEPIHRRMTLLGADGVARDIEVTALPLKGEGDRMLGALAVFWEHSRQQ